MNAAWSGPRRARTVISSIPLALRTSIAIGGVGDLKLGRRQREHPRDIDRDVSRPDDDCLPGPEINLEPRVIGVAVVPGDKLGGGVRATQILPRDPEPLVDRGADRVEDDVVVLEQLLATDIGPELDVAEEAKAFVFARPVVGSSHRLDLRMVRSHTRADEPVRRRQPVIQIDGELRFVDRQQLTGGVEAGGAGTHNGHTERRAISHGGWRRGT